MDSIDMMVIIAPCVMGIIILVQFIGDVLKEWYERSD